MTNQTPEVSIQVLDEDHDVAIAELTEIGIESFLQTEIFCKPMVLCCQLGSVLVFTH